MAIHAPEREEGGASSSGSGGGVVLDLSAFSPSPGSTLDGSDVTAATDTLRAVIGGVEASVPGLHCVGVTGPRLEPLAEALALPLMRPSPAPVPGHVFGASKRTAGGNPSAGGSAFATVGDQAVDRNSRGGGGEAQVSAAAAAAVTSSSAPTSIPGGTVNGRPKVLVHEGNIRSGHQVYADKGQSLMVLGTVNPGGEALADGSVYIFGTLKGRAFAGLALNNNGNGSNTASSATGTGLPRKGDCYKIVAQSFDAELVSIGTEFLMEHSADAPTSHPWACDNTVTLTLDDAGKFRWSFDKF